jgi:hypothetical protein
LSIAVISSDVVEMVSHHVKLYNSLFAALSVETKRVADCPESGLERRASRGDLPPLGQRCPTSGAERPSRMSQYREPDDLR